MVFDEVKVNDSSFEANGCFNINDALSSINHSRLGAKKTAPFFYIHFI